MSVCARCLFRRTLSLRTNTTAIYATSSFHTSTVQYANPNKKKTVTSQPAKFRESTSAKIKTKKRERPRPPLVGERKAQRTRIVLSNTNALEIHGMPDLTADNMADEEVVGQVLGLQGPLLDQLREAKVFKRTQNWGMFRKPATLIRRESVEMGKLVQGVNESTSDDQGLGSLVVRRIIAGERSTGKSLLLLQAMSIALMNGWIVISVPEG